MTVTETEADPGDKCPKCNVTASAANQVTELHRQLVAQAAEIERLKATCADMCSFIEDYCSCVGDEDGSHAQDCPKCAFLASNPGRPLLQLADAVEDDGLVDAASAHCVHEIHGFEGITVYRAALRAARDKEPTP